MSSGATTSAPRSAPEPSSPWRRFNKLVALIFLLGLVAIGAFGFELSRNWPFSQTQTLKYLREASDSQVKVRSFHQTFFPAPGCVLEGVVFHHGPADAKPIITIAKLTIQGSYLGILSQHVSRVVADGMRVTILPFGTNAPFHTAPTKIKIDAFVADGATIELQTDPPEQPLLFDVHEAFLQNLEWSGPLSYRVKVHNPEPPGEVSAQGKFGVWNLKDPGETPLSGTYTFENADLSVYEGIAGMLSLKGKFDGKLAHIDISGTIGIPDFKVKSKHTCLAVGDRVRCICRRYPW